FFFSSRRRHTRSDRDWSSDVCSSDLHVGRQSFAQAGFSLGGRFAAQPSVQTEHPLHRVNQMSDAIVLSAVFHALKQGEQALKARSEERRVGKECRWRRWEGE